MHITEVRTAVLGAGYWGKNVARSLSLISNLKYIVDINIDAAKLLAARFGAKATQVLEPGDVDAVAIVTPPDTHLHLTREYINKGMHVFVEKPLTLDSESSKELVEIETQTNLITCVGHTFLFDPGIIALKSVIDKGLIGNPLIVSTHRMNLGKYQSSGILLDLLPHDLSILRWIFKKEMNPIGCVTSPIHGIASEAMVRVDVGNIPCSMHMSWIHTEKVRKIVVVGSQATVEYDMSSPDRLLLMEGRSIQRNVSGDRRYIPIERESEPLIIELSHFIGLCNGSVHPDDNRISFIDGAAVVDIISALEKIC